MIFSRLQLLLLAASCAFGINLPKSLPARLHQTPHALISEHLADMVHTEGLQLRSRERSAQATSAVSASAASYDYMTMYVHSADDCSDSSVIAGAAMSTYCISMSFDGFAFSAQTTCTDANGYVMDMFIGKDCKSSGYFNTTTLIPASIMNTCMSSEDGETMNSYATYQCSNNINHDLEEGSAIGYYFGDSCEDQRMVTMYYKHMSCETVGADSVSSTCSSTSLDINTYEGVTDCNAASLTNTTQYTTNECIIQENDDDDHYYYGDSFQFTGSYYAACSVDDLPDSAFQHFVSAWAIVLSLVAGVVVLRN